MDILCDELINETLNILTTKQISIYTFAFYHDHESDAISICIDTESNSEKVVNSSNEFTLKYFHDELSNQNLDSLKLWNINSGRNLSLGDFQYANIVYKNIDKRFINSDMYLSMINSIERNKSRIVSYSKCPDKIVFCCSSADNEVAYIWK